MKDGGLEPRMVIIIQLLIMKGIIKKYSVLMWINEKFVNEEGYVELPAKARIVRII